MSRPGAAWPDGSPSIALLAAGIALVGALRAAINSTINESMFRKRTNEQLEHVQVGHETILACLERGDAEESGRAMTAHFADAVMSLVYGLGDDAQHSKLPEVA